MTKAPTEVGAHPPGSTRRATPASNPARSAVQEIFMAKKLTSLFSTCSALILLFTVNFCATASDNSESWKTYRNAKGEFEIKYPNSLTLHEQSGTRCINNVCQPVESFTLENPDQSINISFFIQRQLIKNNMTLVQYFESQLHRPLNPSSEKIISLAGKTAIQRKGMFPTVIFTSEDGKTKTTQSSTYMNAVDIQISQTDVLSINCKSSSKIYDEVLSNLKFSK